MDPVDAVLEALAVYFRTVAGIAAADPAWPEHQQDLDLTSGPVVTLTRIDDQRVTVSPGILNTTKPFLWRTAELRVLVQLDLWAAYKAQREAAAAALARAFDNDLPFRTGLYLTSGYHSRPLTVAATDGRPVDDASAAAVGEWRRMWTLEVTTDIVAETDTPSQDELTLRPTVNDTTDPDFDV